MRYVLLIYGSEVASARMAQEERAALMQGHAAFANEALQLGTLHQLPITNKDRSTSDGSRQPLVRIGH